MRLLLVLLAVTVLLAACGGSEDDTPTDAAPRSESATSAPTDAPTGDPAPSTEDDDEADDTGDGAASDDDAGDDDADSDTADDGTGDDGAAADGTGGSGDDDRGERELTDADQTSIIGDVGEAPVTGGDATDGVALLTDVRVGDHEGFDRIVLEFAGDAVPSYRVAYADPPITAAGSGAEVEIDGGTYLEIHLSGASGVDLSGDQAVETYTGPQRVEGDTSTVVEVVRTGDFEAELTWVAGLAQQMPFAVSTLSDPARLVVDVEVL